LELLDMNRRNRLRLDWCRPDRLRLDRRQLLSSPSVTAVTRFMTSLGFFFRERLRHSVN
jgi:hypothetical protein